MSFVDNLLKYYSKDVVVSANGKIYNRDQLIEHCEWGIENEVIDFVNFADIVAENNKIAFRVIYKYSNKTESNLTGENIGIMELNSDKKIIEINVKSSEQFVIEE
ncbi:MAG: hypothetical protein H0T84_06685 [Tatlockia sp.]|nr:hypothetical protein [Tatlockia sp.]